jgi:hypothetical protein
MSSASGVVTQGSSRLADRVDLVFHPVSPDRADVFPRLSAVETCLLEAFDGDTRVGYVKASFTTPELVADRLPSPLHYMSELRGWCGVGAALKLGDVPRLWLETHRHARVSPASLQAGKPAWSLSRGDVPDEPTALADIEAVSRSCQARFDRWVEFFSVPFVAFSKVEEPFRRSGVATALYVGLARQLAGRGQVLRASGLQSDEAAALWEALARDASVPTREVRVVSESGEVSTHLAVDFVSVTAACR